MARRATWTGNGLVLDGRLTVLPEDDAALIQVGGEFLDDALRERFGTDEGDREEIGGAVLLERVRVTVERIDP